MSAPILALVGPTCTGKSRIAALLAKERNCAILSADSMQVYRGMDIGTGKAFDDFGDVRVFGLDVTDPSEPYSSALYQTYGRGVIDAELASTGRIIVCGGTGFYVRALLDRMDFAPGEQTGNHIRDKYTSMAAEDGPQAVWEALRALDPASAASVHPNNVKRVIRALEMTEAGESYAQRADAFSSIQEAYPHVAVAFSYPRELLYDRINARVDAMFESGLVDEVRGLFAQGLGDSLTANQAIGYKEIIAHLAGECTLAEATEAIKQATRRYAKRQISWFKRDPRVHWIDGMLPESEKLTIIKGLWE